MSTPAPDAVWIRVYTLGGQPDQQVRWSVKAPRTDEQWGIVTPGAETTCIFTRPGWRVEVFTEAAGRETLEAHAWSGDFGAGRPLDVSIERDADGKVEIREGIPDWWNGNPMRCAVGD